MAQKIPVMRGVSRSQVKYTFSAIVALTVLCAMVVIPSQINKGIDSFNSKTNIGVPRLPDKGFNFGLDLQGGAHLIYEAKTDQVPSADRSAAVEGVRDVIERRVRGGLGVSEPLVQTTRVGEAYRIIVELPGVKDLSQALSMIKETPILDFKEANTDAQRELTAQEQKDLTAFNAAAQKKMNAALAEARRGVAFDAVVKKYSEDASSTVQLAGDLGFISAEVQPELEAWAKTHKVGEVSREVIKGASGLSVVKKLEERDAGKTVSASHILICYAGATSCTTTDTKEQALAKATALKQLATIQNFTQLAKDNSTEPGAKERGGDLGTFKKGVFVPEFENAIWDAKVGTITGPVETQFGYHLIYKKAETPIKEYRVARVFAKTRVKADIVPPKEEWKTTGLSGKQLKRAEVTQDTRTGQVQVSLQFDDEGTKLFGEITTRNTGKQVAIFLDSEPISIPTVNEPITSGNAVINGSFGFAEARLLAQRLNSGALPVPVELISQQHVDATLGEDSLQKSLKAGLAGLLLVFVFLTFYYRLPGFMAFVALLVYTIVNLAIFKLFGVTLTLSGIAGFILSIGMAVDSNVLVFERLKEELQNGRSLKTALEEAFLRSWSSIRDGHITTLIGAFVLAWFGSGFVQGFAIVLIIGVLMSLFSAVTVTRSLLRVVTPLFNEEGHPLFLGFKRK